MFQKYKYVLAVYREQSFTNAAKKLFISQPSLSVAIRNVEKEVGGPLFERCGSKIKPTEIGEIYIAAAQNMYLAEEEFKKKCLDINELQAGKLVVGGSNYLASYVLPKIITLFRNRFPKVEINLVEANSVHLREMLLNEELDMMIDNFEDGNDVFEKHLLVNETIFLCLPADRPINRQRTDFQIMPESIYADSVCVENMPPIDISLFRDEKFVLLKDGHDMYHRAMAIFEENNMIPNITFRVDQLNISYTLTESGVGACFVADTLFKHRKHTENVVLYKLNTQHTSRKLYIANKKNRYCTRAMSEFIKVAQEIMKS